MWAFFFFKVMSHISVRDNDGLKMQIIKTCTEHEQFLWKLQQGNVNSRQTGSTFIYQEGYFTYYLSLL